MFEKFFNKNINDNQDIIVCECKKVTLGEIINVIKRYNINDVAEITEYTEAGCCCKACISYEHEAGRDFYLVDILTDVKSGKY